jgi:hypothetical protein
MLLPALQRARTHAGLIQCLSGARQAAFAVQAYCNDNGQYYPSGFGPSGDPLWHVKLVNLHYMTEAVQTRRGGCPFGPENFHNAYPSGDYYTHPDYEYEHPYCGNAVSYGLNGHLQSGALIEVIADGWKYLGAYKQTAHPIRKHASQIGMIFCVAVPWNVGTVEIWPEVHYTVGKEPLPWNFFGALPVNGRHNHAGIPVVFCDGHGEVVPPSGVTLTYSAADPQNLLYWSSYYMVYYKSPYFPNN